jgi:tyrosine-protein kinase Etk/Wzc
MQQRFSPFSHTTTPTPNRGKWWYLLLIIISVVTAVLGSVGIPVINTARGQLQIEPQISADAAMRLILSNQNLTEAIAKSTGGVSAFVAHNTHLLEQLTGMDMLSLELEQFTVPKAYWESPFKLRMEADEIFVLYDSYGKALLQGKAGGEEVKENGFAIKVASLAAGAGEEFIITPLSPETYLQTIQKNIRAIKINDSSIELHFAAQEPEFAKHFLDTLMGVYVDKSLENTIRNRADVLANLRAKNKEIQAQLKVAKEALAREDTSTFSEETLELIQLAAGLGSKVGDLESGKTELLATHAPQDPVVLGFTEQIDSYKKQLNSIEPEIVKLPDAERRFYQLNDEVIIVRQLFLDSTAEINRLSREIIKSEAHVISPSVIEKTIDWMKITIAAVLGGVGGVFLCLCFTLFGNIRLRNIRNPEMLKKVTKLPVIASIPHSDSAEKKSKALGMNNYLMDVTDNAALVLRNLKTILDDITSGAHNNILLFTSHHEKQGKSFLAANFSLLASEKKRVLLIDGDILKGSLHLNFSALKVPGFSDLIAGKATLEQVLANPVDEKLWFIPSGTEAANYDLLQDQEKLKSLMHILSEEFDLVIIDCPTLPDLQLLEFAGTIFMVIRQGENTSRFKRFLSQYPRQLTEISAVILNDVVETKAR